jgi:hypothetical protein
MGHPLVLGGEKSKKIVHTNFCFLSVIHRRCRPTGYETGHFLSTAEVHPPIRGASCRAKHQLRLNRELVSYQTYLPVTVISTGSVCGGMQEFALQAW